MRSARRVYQELVDQAKMDGLLKGGEFRLRGLRAGESIPDDLKPGMSMKKLSAEDREALKLLTSEDTKRDRASDG